MTTSTELATVADAVIVDQTKVLQALGLNPADPKTHAVVAVCQRYGLDPVLKHVVIVEGNTFITRDGLLAVAHRSGQLDGIEIVDTADLGDEWRVTVAVHRKDMTHPFRFPGRYPKRQKLRDGSTRPHPFALEMAIKCAESHALRRAFDVSGMAILDEIPDTTVMSSVDAPDGPPVDPYPHDRIAALRDMARSLDLDHGEHWAAWRDEHGFDPRDPAVTGLLDEAERVLESLRRDQARSVDTADTEATSDPF